MKRLVAFLLVSLVGLVVVLPAPAQARPRLARSTRFEDQIVRKERGFFRPNVAFDRKTGMTLDAHFIDRKTGALVGKPRSWSAASKESLHIILLAKALSGNHHARTLLAPTEGDLDGAKHAALDVLTKKITTYERFNTKHPGYGGFLPWYRVGDGKIEPDAQWASRVPGLDNGELAWSMYLVSKTLAASGHAELAARYQAHLDLMKRNVIPIFYDPDGKQLRTEATIGAGSRVAPSANHYTNYQPGHFLDDDKEGLMMAHFADLMGEWKGDTAAREALWAKPRRVPKTSHGLTVALGDTFSPHEDWGFLVLPYRDVHVAQQLFDNAQKGRIRDAVENNWSGLRAATHVPVANSQQNLVYINTLGVQSLANRVVTPEPIFAAYAAFPLAITRPRVFDAWMKSMLHVPGMWGPNGIGESYTENGKGLAPILTWDGKALVLVAMMGGVANEMRSLLKQDGLYDTFLSRTRADYRAFDGVKIEGKNVHWSRPLPHSLTASQ